MTRRRLLVAALAALVVLGLAIADVVTLAQAKPSYRNERRYFSVLTGHRPSTTSTTRVAPAGSTSSSTTSRG